jgi:hypothetical protein
MKSLTGYMWDDLPVIWQALVIRAGQNGNNHQSTSDLETVGI